MELSANQYGRICDLLWRIYADDWDYYGEIFHTSSECRRVALLIEEVLNDSSDENYLLLDHLEEDVEAE